MAAPFLRNRSQSIPAIIAGFASRHPGYSSSLLFTLLATTIILLWTRQQSQIPLAASLDCPRSARPLSSVIHSEETLYREALKDREAMVQKWGPTAELIAP